MNPLRRRMIEDMQVRNLAPQTQTSYLQQIAAFALHFNKSPELLGPDEIRTYQVYLIDTKHVSISSLTVATAALRFIYKTTLRWPWAVDRIPFPKAVQELPIILSPAEVHRFLDSIGDLKYRAIFSTAYATGFAFPNLPSSRVRYRRRAHDGARPSWQRPERSACDAFQPFARATAPLLEAVSPLTLALPRK